MATFCGPSLTRAQSADALAAEDPLEETPSASTQSAGGGASSDDASSRSTAGASDPPGYRMLVTEALREYGAGNHEESRALFLRAHALFPNARTHRGIAMAEFELRNYEACILQLERALSAEVRPLDDKLRADAEQLIERARSFLGRLIVETKPAASTVLVDGAPTDFVAGRPLVLRLGEHVVEAQALGFAPERRYVSMKAGETQQVTIVFQRALLAPENARSSRSWIKSPWLWVALGTLAAGATVGVVLATRRSDARTQAGSGGSTMTNLTIP